MKIKSAALATAVVVGLGLPVGTGVADAAPTAASLRTQMARVLAEHPGGVQTGADTVSWQNGAVTLKLASLRGVADCGYNQFCLWEHSGFGGRMIAWNAIPAICSGLIINLTDYGFNDQASAWADNSPSRFVDVWNDYGAGGGRIWRMLPGASSPNVQSNDAASSLDCY
ncbi:peptidase inhibitor family I36 protein [Embleya sp. NPDC020630]|uniref:peptidase inhibitor family I36 protein n=1 Tax=Embleya sp. NPDC020630 TaxID=3363979 RepID=UPI0037AE2B0C